MGGARIVRVPSPYNGVELAELDYEQSADTMYLAHLNQPPYKLLRFSHISWQFVTVTFGPDNTPPTDVTLDVHTPNEDQENDGNAWFPQDRSYVVTSLHDDTGQESRASASVAPANNDLGLKRNYNDIDWTAPADGLADRYRVYAADSSGAFGFIGITEEVTFRDDNIGPDLSDGPPVADNPFEEAGDYPSAVTFYQQRLMWGRTTNKPNGVWGSKTGDYENMDISRPLQDDDALSFAIVSKGVNAVNHLVPMTDLLALTSDNIFQINGGQDQFISPSNIITSRQVGYGSSRIQPIVVDNVVFFEPSVGSEVRTLGFSFQVDGYQSNNVTIFSPHFFKDMDIVDWAYVRVPHSQIWAARSDGKLLCFTWEQDQEVWGWTLCETDGEVLAVCSISEGGEDRLYLAVRRVIGGVTKTFVERMASATWEMVEQTCFLDCAITNVFTEPTDTITNLSIFAGTTVTALADGNVVELEVSSTGTAILPMPVSIVTAGLPYTALIETLPLAMQTQTGWTIARPSSIGETVLKLVNSRGVLVGPNEDTLDEIKPRVDEPYGQPNDLLNGNHEVDMGPFNDDKVSLVVQAPYPLPFTLTAVLVDPKISN